MATGFRRLNNGSGATLVKDAVAHIFDASSRLEQAAAMAAAVLARDDAAQLEGAEFGAQVGEGQAVHDEIQALNTALADFIADNAVVLARYNPGTA